MAILGFSTAKPQPMSAAQRAPTVGCSPVHTACLQSYAAQLRARRSSSVSMDALLGAIGAARSSLPDPCEDHRLLDHLRGMSALLGLMQLRPQLAPGVVVLLPTLGDLEQATALTAERAYRRTTLFLEGLTAAARAAQPAASAKLVPVLASLNGICEVAQALSDSATTFAAFASAHGVGSHAAKNAALIAELLGRPGSARAFMPREGAELPTRWTDIDAKEGLAMVADKVKERAAHEDGTVTTVSKKLTTTAGKVYHLQSPLSDRTGAHGRVYPAHATSQPQQPLIVKVQRTQRKLSGPQDTLDAPLSKLLQSAAAARAATARVDAGLEAHARLFEDVAGPLRSLDARGATTAVVDQFLDASGKFFQVMRAMAGDLADVSRALSARVDADKHAEPLVARARLSAALQAAVQLVGLHRRQSIKDAGVAHLDLKLPNIVFDEEGIVRIIDFDESRQVSYLGRVRDGGYSGGSLPSPERDSPAYQRKGGSLSKPYDVWCLGATMLELGSPSFYDVSTSSQHPVNVILTPPPNAPPGFGLAEWFSVYGFVWQQHIHGNGPIRELPEAPSPQQQNQAVRRLQLQSNHARRLTDTQLQSYVAACYARLSRFINGRLQADPELTAVLFRQAMAPTPKQRSSARKFASSLTALMARQTEEQRAEVRQLFGSLARATPLTGVR